MKTFTRERLRSDGKVEVLEIVTCDCISQGDVLALHEDRLGLEPSQVSCLRCMKCSCRKVPIDVLDLPAIEAQAGTRLGDILTSAWCEANPQFGLIRGQAGGGNDTFFMRDQGGYVWTVRSSEQRNHFVWHDPDNPQDAVETLAQLPPGVDRMEVGHITRNIYFVRLVAGKPCLVFPASELSWQEWRNHADDRLVILGDEMPEGDIRGFGSNWHILKHGLQQGGFNLEVRCVVRLR